LPQFRATIAILPKSHHALSAEALGLPRLLVRHRARRAAPEHYEFVSAHGALLRQLRELQVAYRAHIESERHAAIEVPQEVQELNARTIIMVSEASERRTFQVELNRQVECA
jgi:hypothetical protein